MATNVFISHSRYDSDLALKIRHWLNDFQFIENIWIDLRELRPGMEFDESIRDGIRQSHIIIVIVSNKSKDSKWVKEEIELSIEYGKTIIPILHRVKPEQISPDNVPFQLLLRKIYVTIDPNLLNMDSVIPSLIPDYKIIEIPLNSDFVVDQSHLIHNLKELSSGNNKIYTRIEHYEFDKSITRTFEESVSLEHDNEAARELELFRNNFLPLFWSNTCFVLSKFVLLTISNDEDYTVISESIHNLMQELFYSLSIRLFDKVSLSILDNNKDKKIKMMLQKYKQFLFPRGGYDGYSNFMCHLYFNDCITPNELVKFSFLGPNIKYQSGSLDINKYQDTVRYLPAVPRLEISEADWYKIIVPQFLSYEIISKTRELKPFKNNDINEIGLRIEDYQTVNLS